MIYSRRAGTRNYSHTCSWPAMCNVILSSVILHTSMNGKAESVSTYCETVYYLGQKLHYWNWPILCATSGTSGTRNAINGVVNQYSNLFTSLPLPFTVVAHTLAPSHPHTLTLAHPCTNSPNILTPHSYSHTLTPSSSPHTHTLTPAHPHPPSHTPTQSQNKDHHELYELLQLYLKARLSLANAQAHVEVGARPLLTCSNLCNGRLMHMYAEHRIVDAL